MIWTDELFEQVKVMRTAGASASQIAHECNISRNAVLGKLFRASHPKGKPEENAGVVVPLRPKLLNARPGASRAEKAELRREQRAAKAAAEEAEIIEFAVFDGRIPIEQRRTLMTLTAGKCAWPVGDPLGDDFFYCGAQVHRKSYCEHHIRRAYADAQVSRRAA